MILSDDEKSNIIKLLTEIEDRCCMQGWTNSRIWEIEQRARTIRLTLESPLVRVDPDDFI